VNTVNQQILTEAGQPWIGRLLRKLTREDDKFKAKNCLLKFNGSLSILSHTLSLFKKY